VTPANPFRGRDRRRGEGEPGAGHRLPLDPDLDPGSDSIVPSETATAPRRVPLPVRRGHPGVVVAIAVGGAFGALSRYEVELMWPVATGHFPVSTFVINTSGAFLLGLILTVSMEREAGHDPTWRYVRLFACVGFLGSWTTMSTIAVESDTLVRGAAFGLAVAYLAATVSAGIAAAAIGTAAGRLHRRVPGASRPGGDR
jgi:fluoride exporter